MSCSVNPRRSYPAVTRPVTDADHSLTLKTAIPLRKFSTFHSPSSPSSVQDAFTPPCLIHRSNTTLDDVINAHRRRVALKLDDIDRSLAADTSTSPSSTRARTALFRDTSLPVPHGLIDRLPVVDPTMARKPNPDQRRILSPSSVRRSSEKHASDSGLGSSVASTKDKRAAAVSTAETRDKAAHPGASAITRSLATSSTTLEGLPGLSPRAIRRIREHTMGPLLEKPSLKPFESIVLDVPRRIRDKEILCLRDLEKTLIYMAPERAKTAALYLDFCLTSVRCIKATAQFLSDREQIRPRDRPYTNLYFIDLEDQIRQYASQLAVAKKRSVLSEKFAATPDEEGDEDADMRPDPTEEVRLFGGLSKNGRPAELIRVKKNGMAFSMATGKRVDLDEDEDDKASVAFKRTLSEELMDEEEVMRSMARRKKNPTPEELAPKKCREPGCNKEFKRPCDLTKHEKTHSRPWKCPEPGCKYHEYGWPTEKEMDRHHNDKHSSSPPMFECQFKPCPYKSKRESNCKQHMEKAHGWCYVRTKSNGKKVNGGSPSSNVVSTPSLHPASALTTPLLEQVPTPPSDRGLVVTPSEHHANDFPLFEPNSMDYPLFIPHADLDMMGGHSSLGLDELDGMDLSPLDQPMPQMEASSHANYAGYGRDEDFTIEDELYAPVQVPTPDHALFSDKMGMPTFPTFAPEQACKVEPLQPHHISPIGQGNAVLYTPTSLIDDEGFEDFPVSGCNLGVDFQLYPSTTQVGYEQPLFCEAPSTGLGFSQTSQDLFHVTMDWSAADYQPFPQQ